MNLPSAGCNCAWAAGRGRWRINGTGRRLSGETYRCLLLSCGCLWSSCPIQHGPRHQVGQDDGRLHQQPRSPEPSPPGGHTQPSPAPVMHTAVPGRHHAPQRLAVHVGQQGWHHARGEAHQGQMAEEVVHGHTLPGGPAPSCQLQSGGSRGGGPRGQAAGRASRRSPAGGSASLGCGCPKAGNSRKVGQTTHTG